MEIRHLDDTKPHITKSVICLTCLRDWQAVFPEKTNIKDLECPDCGRQEAVIFDLVNARKIIRILEDMAVCGGDFERIVEEFK